MKLNVCSLGDPLSSGTWSGTPANLCRVLRDTGHLAGTLDTETYLPRWPRLAWKVASKLYYAGSRYVRLGRLERAGRARRVRAVFPPGREGAAGFLHLGTHDLPPAPWNGRQRHYLFTDTTWNLWQRYATDQEAVSPRLSRDIVELDRQSYAAMDHIFTVGDYVRRDMITTYGVPAEKVTAVGSGRGGIQPYHGEKDYVSGYVLFVAKERFEDKGGGKLLEGFARAREHNPALRLVLAGHEDYVALAARQPGVTGYGHVPFAQLQGLFEGASLFAMPAANAPWGLVYLEALACRTPILGLRRLSLPEITGEGRYGFCLDTAGPEETADALLRAFADPAALARMGAEGQAHCLAAYTWENTVGRIVETIARLQNSV